MLDNIEIYGDGIGNVEYVDHMGSDLTIVNSARVSFGKHKEELDDKDRKLIGITKLATPIRKTETDQYTFKLKLDI